MSRVGRAPVAIPSGVTVHLDAQQVRIEGPKGTLALPLQPEITATLKDHTLTVQRVNDEQPVRALHGLYRSLIANMVTGVSTGFSKELEISGVGYRASLQGTSLSIQVGFSHPVIVPLPEGIIAEVPKPTSIIIRGADKHLVGQFTAYLRRIAPPEPYKGKGIKYVNEVIRRKAGKAATGAGAKSA